MADLFKQYQEYKKEELKKAPKVTVTRIGSSPDTKRLPITPITTPVKPQPQISQESYGDIFSPSPTIDETRNFTALNGRPAVMLGDGKPITPTVDVPVVKPKLKPGSAKLLETENKKINAIKIAEANAKLRGDNMVSLPEVIDENNIEQLQRRWAMRDPTLTYNALQTLKNWASKNNKIPLLNNIKVVQKGIMTNGIGFGETNSERSARELSKDLYHRDGTKVTNAEADNQYRRAAFLIGAIPFGLGNRFVESAGINPNVAMQAYGKSAGQLGGLGTTLAGFNLASGITNAAVASIPKLAQVMGTAGLAKNVVSGALEAGKVYTVMGSETFGRKLNEGKSPDIAFEEMMIETLPDAVVFGLMHALPIKTTKQVEKLVNPLKSGLALGALTKYKGGTDEEVSESILLGIGLSMGDLMGAAKQPKANPKANSPVSDLIQQAAIDRGFVSDDISRGQMIPDSVNADLRGLPAPEQIKELPAPYESNQVFRTNLKDGDTVTFINDKGIREGGHVKGDVVVSAYDGKIHPIEKVTDIHIPETGTNDTITYKSKPVVDAENTAPIQPEPIVDTNKTIPDKNINPKVGKLNIGDVVEHPNFGRGIVVDNTNETGSVKVKFDNNNKEGMPIEEIQAGMSGTEKRPYNFDSVAIKDLKVTGFEKDTQPLMDWFKNKDKNTDLTEQPSVKVEPTVEERTTVEPPQSINKEIWQITPNERGELADFLLGVNSPEQLKYQELNSQLKSLKFKHDMLQGKYEKAKSMFQDKPGDTTKKALDKATKDYLPIAEEYKNLKTETDNAYDLYQNVLPAERKAKYPILDSMGSDVFKDAIKKAIAEGKPVPPEVLADYPDLATEPIPPKQEYQAVAGQETAKTGEEVTPEVKGEVKPQVKSNFYEENASSLANAEMVKTERIAENVDDYIKKLKQLSKDGVVSKSGRILYPVIDVVGEGYFQFKTDTGELIKIVKKSEYGYEKIDKKYQDKILSDLENDRANIYLAGQGFLGKFDGSIKTLEVLHRGKGNSFGENKEPIKHSKNYEEVKPQVDALTGEESYGGVTVSEYEAAKKVLLKEITGNIGMGISLNSQMTHALYQIGRHVIAKGFNTFETWSKEIIKEFGESVKPHLQKIWTKIKDNEAQGASLQPLDKPLTPTVISDAETVLKEWKEPAPITTKARIKQAGNMIYERFFNTLHPIYTDITQKIGDKIKTAATRYNSEVMLSNLRKVTGTFNYMIKEGGAMVNREGVKIEVSLSDLFKKTLPSLGITPDKMPLFKKYLEHKLGIDRWEADLTYHLDYPTVKADLKGLGSTPKEGIRGDVSIPITYKGRKGVVVKSYTDGSYDIKLDENFKPLKKQVSLEADIEAATNYEKQYPEFIAASKRVYKWWDKFMTTWGVGDILPQDQYDAMRSMYEHYIPGGRVQEGDTGYVNPPPSTSKGTRNPTKKAVGGVSEIEDIEIQFGKKIAQYVSAEKTNEAYASILYWARNAPAEMKMTAEEVARTKPTMKHDVDSILEYLADKENGIGVSGKPGKYTLRIFEKGDIVTLRINDNLYRALQYDNPMLNSPAEKLATKVTRGITEPIKYTITGGNPIFTTANLPRDFQTALVNSIERNPIEFTKMYNSAIYQITKNSRDWQEFQALGNMHSTLTHDVNKGWVGTKLERNRALKNVGEFNQNAESVARFAEYLVTLKKLGSRDYDAKMQASYNAANITTDFSRHGDLTNFFDKTLGSMYFNAQMQGFDRNIRQAVNKPLETAGRLMISQVAPAMILMAMNYNNPNYQNLSDREKDSYFMIPNYAGNKDADGNPTTFLKVPRARGISVIGGLFERLARLGQSPAKKAFAGYGNTVSAELPGILNWNNAFNFDSNLYTKNAKIAMLQAWQSQQDWKGAPILPTALQGTSPIEQYNEKTNELIKYTAKLGWSPIQTQAFIQNNSGVIWTILNPVTNYIAKSANSKQLLPVNTDNFNVMKPWIADSSFNPEVSNRFFSKTTNYTKTFAKRIKEITNNAAFGNKPSESEINEIQDLYIKAEASQAFYKPVIELIQAGKAIELNIKVLERTGGDKDLINKNKEQLKAVKKETQRLQQDFLDNFVYNK